MIAPFIAFDKHIIAAVSIVGTSLDFLGGMYLAYDLLGGKHGPLRMLTRAVTYGVLFGIGYGIPYGFVFGLAGGAAHGLTLSLEYSRASKQEHFHYWQEVLFGSVRALAFGIGSAALFGSRFGIVFGLFSALGQAAAYRFGIRPAMDYEPQARPRMTKGQLLSTVNRTFGYGFAGYVSGLVAGQGSRSLGLGLRMGIVVGVVTAIAITLSSWIEWTAENIPEKRLGAFGIVLILLGFTLQSLQYWVVLLDVPVN